MVLETLNPTGPLSTALESLWLQVQVGGRRTFREILEDALIGRADALGDCFPEIDLGGDDAVSRRHARVRRVGGRFELEDLDSTNGTRVNGVWLDPFCPIELSPGDVVMIGDFCKLHVTGSPLPLSGEPVSRAGCPSEVPGYASAIAYTPGDTQPVYSPDAMDFLSAALDRLERVELAGGFEDA